MASQPCGVSGVWGGSACGPSTLWRSEVAELAVRRHSHLVVAWSRQISKTDILFWAQRSELEKVRSTGASGASSSRDAGGSPSLLEARLTGAVLRAEEAQRHLEERLRIRAEAAEVQVAEATKELAVLRVQRPPRDQEEVTRLRAELLAQQTVARSLQQIVTDIGRSRSRSRSGASVRRATGASVGQYLAGSSSRRRNEEEEKRHQGDGSAQSGRGGGDMPPPPDRQEGSGESGGGQ
ncbi:hypothetical protein Taro_048817 [Colocasia esculenta]|uniref:Uncharacterized protein n=1 Tax=Colocasia esculenta TaxID=4460 RepID=A0A843X946_COLES|nr:hypothetical protein [Colocasia esculenta]